MTTNLKMASLAYIRRAISSKMTFSHTEHPFLECINILLMGWLVHMSAIILPTEFERLDFEHREC